MSIVESLTGKRFSTVESIPVEWQDGDVLLDLYEVKGLLGEGGMGKVYRVYHRAWDIDLAVKSPKEELFVTEEGRTAFVREAETWVNMGLHPNTVSCYYVRTLGSVPRVFAECVDGGSLLDWVWYGYLYYGDEHEALHRIFDVAIQTAWGLDHAHEGGLLHQDVKSSNVLMTQDGSAKVTDFGLARAMAEASQSENPQDRILTPEYASPEQLNGDPLSRQSDLFSWAVVVLEMLTRQQPGYGPDSPEVLRAFVASQKAGTSIVKVPQELIDLLTMCLQENPVLRPDTCREAAESLIEIYEKTFEKKYPRSRPVAAERHIDSLNNRAVSLFDLQQNAEARAVLEEALRLDPNHIHASHNIALLCWRTGELKEWEMLRHMKEVRAANPPFWEEKFLMAWVHLERGDAQAVRAALAEATHDPTSDEAAQRAIGQVEGAIANGSRSVRQMTGHHDEVICVAMAPEGRIALSGGKDTAVRLWDLEGGQCRQMLAGHTEPVFGVCMTPDGHIGVSASSDSTLRVWDLSTGECTHILNHGWSVRGCAISDDGQWLIAASSDKTLSVWHVPSARRIRTLTGHRESVLGVSMMPDGSMAISASEDGTLRLWEMAGGQCLAVLEGHQKAVQCVALMPSGRFAVSGGDDNTVRVWEMASGACATLDGHTGPVRSVAVAPGPGLILSAGSPSSPVSIDDSVRLWEIRTGRCVGILRHRGSASGVAIAEDGREGVSCGMDSNLALWSLRPQQAPLALVQPRKSEEVLTIQNEHKKAVAEVYEAVAASDWGRAVERLTFARSQPGYQSAPEVLALWSTLAHRSGRGEMRGVRGDVVIQLHRGGGRAIWLSPSGQRVVTSTADALVSLNNADNGEGLRTLPGHTPDPKARTTGLGAGNEGAVIATPAADHSIKIWDAYAKKQVKSLMGHTHTVNALAMTPDCRLLASASSDGSARVWSLSSGKCLLALAATSGWAFAVAISADGNRLISGHNDRTARLWDIGKNCVLANFDAHGGVVTSVALSPDGELAVTGCLDKTVRIWDMRSGLMQPLQGHSGAVTGVAVTPDCKLVVSASEDRTLRVWEVGSGRCLHVLDGHTGVVSACAITPDGRRIASTSEDLTTRVWTLDWNLVPHEPAEWDEGARPFAQVFLTLHARGGLLRKAQPTWTDAEFAQFLTELGWHGYGWLRPEGVQRELKRLAAAWDGTVPYGI